MGERASTVSERQLLWSLTHDGCPVCDHLRNHEAEFRFWFIAERYHQRELLDALTNSLGFCVDHGEFLADSSRSRSPMTSAHEVVSRRTLSRFEAGEIDRATWSSLATCPACASFERAGDRTVSFLVHGLETSAAEYGDPGIACFPPLSLAGGDGLAVALSHPPARSAATIPRRSGDGSLDARKSDDGD